MSRIALIWILAEVLVVATAANAIDPHMDPSTVQIACAACHEGHGVSRSPMLPASQARVCLGCHGSKAKADRLVSEGVLAATARPQFLSPVMSLPFVHPIDENAYSRHQPGVVTCSSCHSPHREIRDREAATAQPTGRRKLSTRNPSRFEFELCQSCHGSAGTTTQSLVDISRLTNPNNRSYHPVEAPSVERPPSTVSLLQGREINCSDCHGNNNSDGPRGPHGSSVPYILRQQYITVDGNEESPAAFRLCYDCHQRDRLLDMSSSFPLHSDHVIDKRASCATCHNAHGSVDNRALIRFGEETILGAVAPSLRTGRLAFVSTGPGSGSCFLTCHGFDHAPESYGADTMFRAAAGAKAVSGALEDQKEISSKFPLTRKKRPRKPLEKD